MQTMMLFLIFSAFFPDFFQCFLRQHGHKKRNVLGSITDNLGLNPAPDSDRNIWRCEEERYPKERETIPYLIILQ